MHFEPKQRTRVILLLVDVALLCIFSKLAFHTWLPPRGINGFWFYTALLSLLLGSRLITPYFHKPVDVIAYTLSAIVALFLINNWPNWDSAERLLFVMAMSYCGIISSIAFAQIFTKDSTGKNIQRISNSFRISSDVLGNPRIVYSVIIWFAIYVFYRNSAREVIWVSVAWALTVAFSPLETILFLLEKLRVQWSVAGTVRIIGEVIAYQSPNIVLFRQKPKLDLEFGTPVLISDRNTKERLGVALDYVGRDEGVLRRAVEVMSASSAVTESLKDTKYLPDGSVSEVDARKLAGRDERSKAILDRLDQLAGIVSHDSTIEKIYFEVLNESGLEEGRLVETFIGGRPVVYQIVNGLTKEEMVYQKNTYGFVRAQAQKIGSWDESKKRFSLVSWMPQLNSPVFLKAEEEPTSSADTIGVFPRTNYAISIRSIHDLVTHNTAILGILGVGKSMLAIELVERMLADGIKVICLDMTNQYAKELKDFYDKNYEDHCVERIAEAGLSGKEELSENPDEGGSFQNFADALREDISNFLDAENPHKLKIYDPSRLIATRQLSELRNYKAGHEWRRGAAVWAATPVEITRIVSEAALELLQDEMTEKARVCLVYEEAHSLIPEWNTVANDRDRVATNGTARAILQGRKFGLGCLVVTQRTASVTKTILNQCNTVFAMRTFDNTGKDFLSNYVGKDYAEALSSLPERHAVFFGKASTCENPVLIRLNDRDKFIEAFRAEHPVPDFERDDQDVVGGRIDEGSMPGGGGDLDDEIPF